jgi:hypothetical protein
LILLTILPTIYLIYVAMVKEETKILKAGNIRKSEDDFNGKSVN